LTREPRGHAGFGYDPLFLIPEYHRTFGELSTLVKHQLSHRARAFARMRRDLERMIAQGDFDSMTQATPQA
jgi:XTP/dITP diphosphohydrolase